MAKSKGKPLELTLGQKELKGIVAAILKTGVCNTFNYKEMADLLGLRTSENRKMISRMLEDMYQNGELDRVSVGRYRKSADRSKYIEGIVDMTAKGSAYIISDQMEKDVFVSFSNLMHALNGDKVKVMVYASRNADRPEGEVVEILERKHSTIVGVLECCKNYAFLVPSGKTLPYDIFVPMEELNGASDGDKVVVSITSWPEHQKNPIGKVLEVLGRPGDNDTEMNAIMAEFELPVEFPQAVLDAAEKIPFDIPS